MATGPAWRSDLGSPSSLSEVASDPTHDQRIGPRRGKADNNRGPRGSLNGWLHAGGSHDVQSRITYAAHLQDEYPTATVPAAHRSALHGGAHTRLLDVHSIVLVPTAGRRPDHGQQSEREHKAKKRHREVPKSQSGRRCDGWRRDLARVWCKSIREIRNPERHCEEQRRVLGESE